MSYVLYKVAKTSGSKENYLRYMSSESIEQLRAEANEFFSNPDNFIGRANEQWVIPTGQLQSNVITTKAGDKEYHRYLMIREVSSDK